MPSVIIVHVHILCLGQSRLVIHQRTQNIKGKDAQHKREGKTPGHDKTPPINEHTWPNGTGTNNRGAKKIDDRKTETQHKRPNTKMDRHEQDKTNVSAQHQSFVHARHSLKLLRTNMDTGSPISIMEQLFIKK